MENSASKQPWKGDLSDFLGATLQSSRIWTRGMTAESREVSRESLPARCRELEREWVRTYLTNSLLINVSDTLLRAIKLFLLDYFVDTLYVPSMSYYWEAQARLTHHTFSVSGYQNIELASCLYKPLSIDFMGKNWEKKFELACRRQHPLQSMISVW